jgi:GH25 family lysozyme M1 (1,4-beta-N-acetylmuramidase)
MRAFTPSEEETLIKLLAVSAGLPVRLEQFLEQIFFTEQHGRALILQPTGGFGYFYLKRSVYDDEQARAEEVRRLIELMMLIVYLREQGFVILNGGAPESRRQMRFVSALFRDPKPSTAHIVLNERGDYTFEPETICDRADTIIYKGVRLEADLYDLVARDVSGLLYVSPALKTLIPPPPPPPRPHPAPEPPPAPEPVPSRLRAVGWWTMFAPAVCATAWLAHRSTSLKVWFANAAPVLTAALQPVSQVAAHGFDGAPRLSTPAPRPALEGPVGALPAPPASDADATERHGIDLSRWNAGILESALDANRIDFVFVRATYGRSTDIDFNHHWNLLRDRKVVRGAYHFYLVHDDPIEQVEHFLSVIGDSEPLEMAPALDFEELSFPPRATPPDIQTVQNRLLSALAHIETRTRRLPVLYTNVSVGNNYLDDPRFARYPLWIADWTPRDEPTVPKAWKAAGYRFWQRTSQYRLAGTGGPVDYDIFKGRLADLYR